MKENWFFYFITIILFNSISLGSETCQMFVDSQRILHIKASQVKDEAFCIGYAHGKQRAVEMDYFRRTVYGTNAEVHGFSQLKSDMMMRLLNLSYWAGQIYQDLSEDRKAHLQRYCDGVNQGIQESNSAKVGELASGYPPIEKWTAIDSLSVLLLQSFDQTRKTFTSEVEELKALPKWQERTLNLYTPDHLPWETTILKSDEVGQQKNRTSHENTGASGRQNALLERDISLASAWADFPEVFGQESGSNNWVVNSSLSGSKVPLLANDPHLDLKTPMFWLWMHIESPEMDVIGATLPGVPLVVSGANKNLSWGLTNAYYNTADLLELSDDVKTESFFPLVWVKWHFLKLPVFFKRFQKLESNFPIIPLEPPADRLKLALRWSGFYLKAKDVDFIFSLNKIQDAKSFDEALKSVGLPAWNFVFADSNGHTGFRIVGQLFRSDHELPVGIQKGNLQDLTHPQFVDVEDRPHLFDAQRAWIVTANNRHFPPGSVLNGGRSYTQSFRAHRIEELLVASKRHSVDSFEKIQCDHQVNDARFLIPLILPLFDTAEFKVLKEKLSNWDMQAHPDCEVCGVYRKAMMNALEEMQINEAGFYRLAQAQDPIWKEAVKKSFLSAEKEVGYKKWHDIHVNPFAHITKNETWKFSQEISTSGDKHSVSPGSMNWDEDRKLFVHTGGASQRMIVEMKKTPEIWLNMPGLNSDYYTGPHPLNGNDPWKDWEDCRYTKVQWPVDWSQIKNIQSIENK